MWMNFGGPESEEEDESESSQQGGSESEEEDESESSQQVIHYGAKNILQSSLKHILEADFLAENFATHGPLSTLPLPGLHVKGVGNIPVPLPEEFALKLINKGSQAPFGKGEKTVVDTSVRNGWQINSKDVTLKNPEFSKAVDKLLNEVKEKFGCKKAVTSTLYKLLIYEKGGFFKKHRDTEKEPGMFGTLILQLPSLFKGGQLIVKHGKKEVKVPFSGANRDVVPYYAAFYADCEHELKKITSGFRIALVYNICWHGSTEEEAIAPPLEVLQNKLKVALESLYAEDEKEAKFCIPLSHYYSETAMEGGIEAMKGGDRALVNALKKAATASKKKYTLCFAKLQRMTTFYGDDYDYGNNNFNDLGSGKPDEIEYEFQVWKNVQGQDIHMTEEDFPVDFEDDRILVKDKEEDESCWGVPFDTEDTGPTGNEGCTLNKWYARWVIAAYLKKTTLTEIGNMKKRPAGSDGGERRVRTKQDVRMGRYGRSIVF